METDNTFAVIYNKDKRSYILFCEICGIDRASKKDFNKHRAREHELPEVHQWTKGKTQNYRHYDSLDLARIAFRARQVSERLDAVDMPNDDEEDHQHPHEEQDPHEEHEIVDPGYMESVPGVPAPGGELLDGQDVPALNVPTTGQKRSRDDEPTAMDAKKWPGWPGDNVYRLIVPTLKVGSIIGRKGAFIKKMCEETRSRIKILDGAPGIPERVVMVSARDEPEAAVAPAMDGLLRVHRRILDGLEGEGDGSIMHPSSAMVTSRLLVPATQAGNLIGRQGTTIKSIQDAAGAIVRVLSVEEVPPYALPDDRVVEVQGEPGKVSKALELVVSHLRKFLVDRSILPLFEVNRALHPQSQQAVPHPSWGSGMATSLPNTGGSGFGGASSYSAPPLQSDSYYQPADLYDTQIHHGLSLYGRDPGVSNTQVAPPPVPIITQVTQKMQIPISYADAIIGTAGSNVSYMRRTSGATITIQETRGVHGEMTVEIHGTASQVQAAQQMIQNSMAGASGPSYTPVDSSYGSYNSQSLYSSTTGGMPSLASTSYGSAYGYFRQEGVVVYLQGMEI